MQKIHNKEHKQGISRTKYYESNKAENLILPNSVDEYISVGTDKGKNSTHIGSKG